MVCVATFVLHPTLLSDMFEAQRSVLRLSEGRDAEALMLVDGPHRPREPKRPGATRLESHLLQISIYSRSLFASLTTCNHEDDDGLRMNTDLGVASFR